ncbi:MAG: CDP-glucose 4,6-dehydratase, partial [Thiohalomonadales bacterium]
GKKVLITGNTGFKGSWLTLWLLRLGANVVGLSIDIPSNPSNHEACNISDKIRDNRIDIRNSKDIERLIVEHQPDFVFHLAAQALVRPSYEHPLDTFTINSIGTANLLNALRLTDKKLSVVMITSDKCYDNVEWSWGYRETDRLGGIDPYSASKGMAELVIRSYVGSYFVGENNKIHLGIARAGNVIGGGDWAQDRIVPDCMESWSKEKKVEIRSPNSTRPWQHVLEPLSGYLSLAADLSNSNQHHGHAYNFGPPGNQNYSVADLLNEMKKYWRNVKWKDISQDQQHLHEAGLLKLNCDKVLHDLNWLPTLNFEETVEMTVDWYKCFYDNKNQSMYEYSINQINKYMQIANDRDMVWAK